MSNVTLNDLMQFQQFLSEQEKQLSAEFGKAFDKALPPVKWLTGSDAMYRQEEENAFDAGWESGIQHMRTNSVFSALTIEQDASNYASGVHHTPNYDPRDDAEMLYEQGFIAAVEAYKKIVG